MNKMSKKVMSLVILGTIAGGQVVYAVDGIKKDESVYVTLTENGVIKEQIVSDWIHSDSNNIDIKDKSELKDIKNIKGDEKPEINGENITWKSEKNDIYYQGKTNKQLPLDVKVNYELDGKEVNPKDIAGKSGKLKIKLSIINKDAHKVTVKGKEKTIYTPFSAVSVINLPIDHFTNIKVNAGEVISDGNNQIATFVSLPGMKESLGLDKDNSLDIELKDTLEITCDTKDFQMGPIMVTATPKLPDELKDIKNADNIKDLTDGLNKLKDATNKLVDGTAKLSDGAKLMSDKIALLHSSYSGLGSGIDKLSNGLSTAYNGASQLSKGIEQYNNGVTELANGVNKFATGANEFAEGANEFAKEISLKMSKFNNEEKKIGEVTGELTKRTPQLRAGNEKLANELPQLQIGTKKILEGAKQVDGGLNSVTDGLNKLYQGQEMQEANMEEIIKGVSQMEQLVNTLPKGPQKETLKIGLQKQKAGLEQLKTKGIGGTKEGINKLKGGVSTIKKGINNKDAKQPGMIQGLSQMDSKIPVAVEGSKKLAVGSKQLDEKVQSGVKSINEKLEELNNSNKKKKLIKAVTDFNKGADELTKGAKALSSGSKQLSGGGQQIESAVYKLRDGIGQLSNGSSQLKSGSSKVYDGIGKLKDGSSTLAEKSGELRDGMKKFEDEGIKKIDDKLGNKVEDIEEILDTKDEVVKLSDNYKTFAGAGEDMEANVKFVFKTDEIEHKKEESKKAVVKEEKLSFWQKVKKLFKK